MDFEVYNNHENLEQHHAFIMQLCTEDIKTHVDELKKHAEAYRDSLLKKGQTHGRE